MITEYDPNIPGMHTVRFTLMQWDYIGHIAFKVGGNCKGAGVLFNEFYEHHTQFNIDKYVENDCEFSYDEDQEVYTALLTNSEGETLLIDDWDENDLRDSIVCAEIVNLVKEN